MSFSKCPYCKTLVDRQAVACPHCTRDLASAALWKPSFFEMIIFLGVISALFGYFSPNSIFVGVLAFVFLIFTYFIISIGLKIKNFISHKFEPPHSSVTTFNSEPSEETHTRCISCYEFVLPQASKCKHCGTDLIPDEEFELRKVKPGFDLDAWMALNPLRGLVVAFSLLILVCTYTGYVGYLLIAEIWEFWTRS